MASPARAAATVALLCLFGSAHGSVAVVDQATSLTTPGYSTQYAGISEIYPFFQSWTAGFNGTLAAVTFRMFTSIVGTFGVELWANHGVSGGMGAPSTLLFAANQSGTFCTGGNCDAAFLVAPGTRQAAGSVYTMALSPGAGLALPFGLYAISNKCPKFCTAKGGRGTVCCTPTPLPYAQGVLSGGVGESSIFSTWACPDVAGAPAAGGCALPSGVGVAPPAPPPPPSPSPPPPPSPSPAPPPPPPPPPRPAPPAPPSKPPPPPARPPPPAPKNAKSPPPKPKSPPPPPKSPSPPPETTA